MLDLDGGENTILSLEKMVIGKDGELAPLSHYIRVGFIEDKNFPDIVEVIENSKVVRKQIYRIIGVDNYNTVCVVNTYPNCIFYNLKKSKKNLEWWKCSKKHELAHSQSGTKHTSCIDPIQNENNKYDTNVDSCGFRETTENQSIRRGDLLEEAWAVHFEGDYGKNDTGLYQKNYELFREILDLMVDIPSEKYGEILQKDRVKQDPAKTLADLKTTPITDNYKNKKVGEWESADKETRTQILIDLLQDARYVFSSRMAMRDLVNAVDPTLWDTWFDAPLSDEGVKSARDKMDGIKKTSKKHKL